MLPDILYIVIGIVLVLKGADYLTEGASSLARRMKVPEIVIGLTIVAAGTSAPELFVSIMSALKGTPDLAVGNVIGSNIFNSMLIVGCAAMVAPMVISPSTVKKDMPFAVIASLLLVVLCLDSFSSLSIVGNSISRIDGILLLTGFAVFMVYTFRVAIKKGGNSESESGHETMPAWKGILLVIIGLAGLVFGSNLFVSSASDLAASLGVSEGVIGLTVVAGGTSLPELATSVVAARKGRSAIAIGNVIGSNVFNLLLILGITAVICPMQIGGITMVDVCTMLVSMILVWAFSFTKYTVERWEGALLTILFFGYMGWLLYNL